MTTLIIRNTTLVFMLFAIFFTACKHQEKEETSVSNAERAHKQTVEVVHPQQQSFNAEVMITGTAQPNRIVTLYAMEGGVLTTIRNEIGDHIGKGQTIAVLENPNLTEDVSKAEAALSEGKSKIGVANADIEAVSAKAKGLRSLADRLQNIYAKTPQITSIVDVESAQANASEADAMIRSKRAILQSLTPKLQSPENLQS